MYVRHVLYMIGILCLSSMQASYLVQVSCNKAQTSAGRDTYRLWNAVVENDQETFASLIDKHNANTYLQEEDPQEGENTCAQHTLVLVAIRQGYLEIAHRLMDYQADVWQSGPHGAKPLHWLAIRPSLACHNAYHSLVHRLLLKGQAFARDAYDNTPIHWAAQFGNHGMIKTLLAWAPIANFRNIYDDNPLHVSVKKEHEDIADMLITQSLQENLNLPIPHPIRSRHAIAHGIKEVHDGNIDICQYNYEGLTPLHISIATENVSLVRTLALRYYQNIDVFDHHGRTALYYAVQMKNMALIVALIENGADPNKCTDSGLSTLHIISQFTEKEEDPHFHQFISDLISLGTSPYATEMYRGDTPMHTAAQSGNLPLINSLLENGISADMQNSFQESPLFYAVQQENSDVIRKLALSGAQINAQSSYKATPLHNAVAVRNFEATKLLLSYGAPLNLSDQYFLKPHHIAQWQQDDVFTLFFVTIPRLIKCTSVPQVKQLLDSPHRTRYDLELHARIADQLNAPDAAGAIRYWLFFHEQSGERR